LRPCAWHAPSECSSSEGCPWKRHTKRRGDTA
jgi:hypothetical protein